MRNMFAFFVLCVLGLAVAAQNQGSENRALYAPVGKCPKVDGSIPVYLPDSEDKAVFYQCRLGVPHPHRCPPNTIFNPDINVCDHAPIE